MRHRHVKFAAILPALLLPGLLISGRALAYWELIPRIEGGITTETNPNNRVESENYDSATGGFIDLRLDGALQTPRDVVTLVPRLRSSRFGGSDSAQLDDDDYSINLNATHSWDIASTGLEIAYRDNGIRTSEFNTANPGQTTDDSQKTLSFDPSLNYALSERNSFQFTADLTDIEYDASPTSGYYDYRNSGLQATWIHVFDAKTSMLLSANGGKFKATDPYSVAENTTDSLGGTVAMERKLTPTISTTVTLGSTHSTQDVEGLIYDPNNPGFLCPTYPVLCSISESSNNFTGGVTLRQRSEVMTTTIDYSQSQAPRSNGTSVVSDSYRIDFQRTLTRRLDGSINLLYTSDSALGNFGRQDRAYFSGNAALRYRLTNTLTLNGSYNHSVNNDDGNSGKQKNDSLYLSVIYTGVGIRH